MVNETDIVELELKSRKFSLAVRKKDAIEKPEPIYHQVQLPTPYKSVPLFSSFETECVVCITDVRNDDNYLA